MISANVRELVYNPGAVDQFRHRYRYDADNRLTHAYASDDGAVSDLHARYRYYAYGPLARVELGDAQVQGVDYAYTLQGWIRSDTGAEWGEGAMAIDPGGDGGASANQFASSRAFAAFGTDELGYTLGYYPGDYTPIGGGAFVGEELGTTSALDIAGGAPLAIGRGLYNGNVPWMRTRLASTASVRHAGHDVRFVQAFAGHRYASTTERYRTTSAEALAEAIWRRHSRQWTHHELGTLPYVIK